jgi:hypothetical protein
MSGVIIGNGRIREIQKRKRKEWADEELMAVLGMLTRHKEPGTTSLVSGYLKLKPYPITYDKTDESFEINIIKQLRHGKIVIIDLSQGDIEIQRLYSERICTSVFADAMNRFVNNEPSNFLQFF